MPTEAEMMADLQTADAAGDTELASKIAGQIKAARAPKPQMGPLASAAAGFGDVANVATSLMGTRPALAGALGSVLGMGTGDTIGDRYKSIKDSGEASIEGSRQRLRAAAHAAPGVPDMAGDLIGGTAGIAGDTVALGPVLGLLGPASTAARGSHVLKRAAAGLLDAVGLSGITGAVRGTATEAGPGAAAKDAMLSPLNLLGAVAPVVSAAVGGRPDPASGLTKGGSRNAARESTGRLLRLKSDDVTAPYDEPTPTGAAPHPEESFRRAGQRALDLGAAEPGMEMGQRAQLLGKNTEALSGKLENTTQELTRRGATVDRTALLSDIWNAFTARFAQPGTKGFNTEARAAAVEVMKIISKDPELATGAPFSNFVNAKRNFQATFEKHKVVGKGDFNAMLEKSERDVARIFREHTESAALRADPKGHGPEFVRLNRQLYKDIPLREGAERATSQGLDSRDHSVPSYATTPQSFAERAGLGQVIKHAQPYWIKGNLTAADLFDMMPNNYQQILVQRLRDQKGN